MRETIRVFNVGDSFNFSLHTGDSHGDPERTEAAHHQWQDSPSPSPSHSGHQGPKVTREQGPGVEQREQREKPVNRDLVEMVSD